MLQKKDTKLTQFSPEIYQYRIYEKNTERDGCNVIVLYNGNRFKKRLGGRGERKRRGETKESETAQTRGWLTKFMYEGGCAFEPRDSRRVEFRSLLADVSRWKNGPHPLFSSQMRIHRSNHDVYSSCLPDDAIRR